MRSGRRVLQFALAATGLLISIYLTLYHYAGVPLVCSETGLINCASVLNSPLASIFGIPIAVYGMVFFVVAILLLFQKNLDAIAVWNLFGVGSVVYFVYLEHVIGSICIWCTAVHLTAIILFAISVYDLMRKAA